MPEILFKINSHEKSAQKLSYGQDDIDTLKIGFLGHIPRNIPLLAWFLKTWKS